MPQSVTASIIDDMSSGVSDDMSPDSPISARRSGPMPSINAPAKHSACSCVKPESIELPGREVDDGGADLGVVEVEVAGAEVDRAVGAASVVSGVSPSVVSRGLGRLGGVGRRGLVAAVVVAAGQHDGDHGDQRHGEQAEAHEQAGRGPRAGGLAGGTGPVP